jgi:hypothetical protein
MRHVVGGIFGALLISSVAFAAKPPPAGPSNPQVAYVVLSGKTVKLMVADESGANAAALYSSPTSFRFDLAPRAQQQVAINGRDGTLRLLSYTTSGTGALTAVGSPVALAPATSGTTLDFSPDGRRIAYSCCDGGAPQKLMVYDLDTQTATEWATVQFVWDVAFFRGGASIAYAEPSATGGQDLYEITAPKRAPGILYNDRSDFHFDAARTNPDALVLDYHDVSGNAFVGLWQAPVGSEAEGHFLVPNLTNRSIAFFGTLNCRDDRLAYMSSTTPAGGQVFFVRNLNTNQDALFAKSSNMQLQFWPTCS